MQSATPEMLQGTIATAREAQLAALPAYQILVLDRLIEDKKRKTATGRALCSHIKLTP